MVNAFKAILVLCLVILAFAIYPSYRNAVKIDQLTELAAREAMVEFVDTARGKGYIDVRDYKTFRNKLDKTSGVYNVKIEYQKKVLQPNYTNPDDFNTFEETFNVRYDGYYTKQILTTLYPSNTLADDDPSRRFNMYVGDLINVVIEPQGSTLASRLGGALFGGGNALKVDKYGGMVRSEAP